MIHAPKGIEDVLPPRAASYQMLERRATALFQRYGYELIRIPTLEKTELFVRSVGEETDVGKQMYTFEDKAGRSLSLRPEGTAGIARAYVEHKLHGTQAPWKVYYAGSMFRYERPQAGRLREFYQIGVEMFGEESPWADAEVIEVAYRLFQDIGLHRTQVFINSIGCPRCRPGYIRELQAYLKERLDRLCPVCQHRFDHNPLRILDCKNEACREQLAQSPVIETYLCAACREAFAELREHLRTLAIPFVVDAHLVRGLDYYTRTIFEIVAPEIGAQSTVCAGGRYDELVGELGGPDTPALGFALGVERVVIALGEKAARTALHPLGSIYFATMGAGTIATAMRLAGAVREQGLAAVVNLEERSLSSQLRQAAKDEHHWTFIIGEEEVRVGRYTLKNMETGRQIAVKDSDMHKLRRILKEEGGQ